MDAGEEEDDFGDFGGFEVAEPVLPNVAQVEPSGVEACPSPWAVFAAGTSPGNVKPDLLCGQNRFPPVLDPSVPSSSADVVQNVNNNGSNQEDVVAVGNSGTAEDQNNFEDATIANDILDGSFKSSSSQHSNCGATASDLFQNSEDCSQTSQKEILQVPVDLVGDLMGASPGIVVVEDDSLAYDESNVSPSVPLKNQSSEEKKVVTESKGPQKLVLELGGPTQHVLGPQSPAGSSHSSEIAHTSSPLLIDSLRKAMQPKSSMDMIRLTSRQSETLSATKIETNTTHIDSTILEELKQTRTKSQAAITSVVEQYKELSRQCVSQQEEVLKECKQILKQEQEKQIQELLWQQKEDFAKALEVEKGNLRKEASDLLQELIAEQKNVFDAQMEEEKAVYERRLREALEEEKEVCRKKLEESVETEKQILNKKLEEERSKMREEMNAERKKYVEEMKAALNEEREKNKETMRELLNHESDHCRECLKAAIQDTKIDMQNCLSQQKQKDRVVRQRQLSSLDVFLETAKQQLNVLIESNQCENDSSVLEDEKDGT